MFNIVFADEKGLGHCGLGKMIGQIASNNGLEILNTNVTETDKFEMVEVVMENDDRAIWRELLSTFQVLTSGRLTLE